MPLNETEFLRRMAAAPDEEVDAETAERVLSAESEDSETISHHELKQRLGL